ncbi:MAG: PadR family transcriptional regulator [Candidatus Nanoarchaeia archaeon]|nr:PadR family transcriptional regulator [Candidatus Haiyanarchaeum thermophilum]MCW1303313.1 PadR family transcriptional regulator [Candidatus Haiyanarchaeum thermophilum]MCW1304105.1 PadR family transcriptional regulator [Candidatus Haiyanarchaeum thermophilum]MCW1306472.1 PadR family transcriptional regulator [Candidatus Haiyanarchaeum thermophilum]MCW1307231.1 PadR family transcriptional regulator [Candidatus Haiyanarchaeum thermophilum]
MERSREILRLWRNLTTETLWIWILKLLSKRPMHAYVLRNELSSFGFSPSRITCYKVLYLLQFRGYVKSRKLGRRRYYYLTKKGREELRKAIKLIKEVEEKLKS